MTAYEKFQTLLKYRYGLEPIDVGVETEEDYCSLAGSDTPAAVVAWLGKRYGLLDIRKWIDWAIPEVHT